MNWDILRSKVYYLDGSFRDIYVFDTSRDDWQKWIDYVNNNYRVTFYNGLTDKFEANINPSIVFSFWDGKTDLTCNASVHLGKIIVKCYFFCDFEIDNDIQPEEIENLEDHNTLIEYLQNVSKLLGKKVILTDEGNSILKKELVTISEEEYRINVD